MQSHSPAAWLKQEKSLWSTNQKAWCAALIDINATYDKDGKVTTVDKTWGFLKDSAAKLRINLHHSSLEYQSN